jgi:chromate transporter
LSSFGKELALQINYLSVGVTAYILYVLGCYIAQTLDNNQALQKKRPGCPFHLPTILIIITVFLLTCGDQLYQILGIDTEPLFGIGTVNVMAAAFFLIFWLREDYRLRRVIPAVIIAFLYCLCTGGTDMFSQTPLPIVLPFIMLVMALWGLAADLRKNKLKLNTSIIPTLKECWAALIFMILLAVPALLVYDGTLSYLLRGALSSLLSFGGGDAYLAVAGGMFVTSGLILHSDFYSNLVPIANAVPGSILCKILTGTGYFLGYRGDGNIWTGILTAFCGFGCAVAMSCITYSAGAYFYEQLENASVFAQLKKATRPIISGLLCTVSLGLFYNCMQIGENAGLTSWFPPLLCFACLGGELIFVKKFRYRPLYMVILSALAALICCNLAAL